MTLTGETIDTAKALEYGFVSEVVAPEAVVPRALEVAHQTGDHHEAVAAFVEKRAPDFSNR